MSYWLHLVLPVPPNKVVVSGPKTLRGATPLNTFICESAHANPSPNLRFKILDREGTDVSETLERSGNLFVKNQQTVYQNTGWISKVEMLVKSGAINHLNSAQVRVVCEATGGVSNQMEVEILSPPQRLSITGPSKIKSDHIGEFHCMVQPEFVNPSPALQWRLQVRSQSKDIRGSEEVLDGKPGIHAKGGVVRISPRQLAEEFGQVHDFVVECLASHPENGKDLIAITHIVEVLCKLLINCAMTTTTLCSQ